ncbi:MAG: hypothetical protein GY805_23130 [Chloroflexi bacterium]|nr:hypothetical protein [Chloroflexota bacterium]
MTTPATAISVNGWYLPLALAWFSVSAKPHRTAYFVCCYHCLPLNSCWTLVLRPYSSTTYRHNYGCVLQRYLLLLETAVLHTNPRGDQKSGTV